MSAKLDSAIAAGLLAVVALTALAHGAVEPWSLAIFELMIVALLALWGVKSIVDKRLVVRIPRPGLALAGLVAVGLAGGVAFTDGSGVRRGLSLDTDATRTSTLAVFLMLAAFMVGANFFASHKRLQVLAHFLVIYGLVLAVFALVQHFAWNGRFYWLRPNTEGASPFGPFVNHNHFSGYMELLIPVPVSLFITSGVRGETRLFYGFAAAVMGVAAVASLSRGGMISLAAGLLFIVTMSGRARRARGDSVTQVGRGRWLAWRLRPVAAAGGIVAAIAIGILWIGSDPVVNRIAGAGSGDGAAARQAETFSTSRGWVWRDTMRMIRANPVIGVGLGAFERAYPIYSQSDGSLLVSQSHNDYLQVVADCGIVGGALTVWFLVLIGRAVAAGTASRDRFLSGWALGGGASVFTILVHSLFDFNLQVPSNALLFLLVSAAVSNIAAGRVKARKGKPAHSMRVHALAGAPAAAGLIEETRDRGPGVNECRGSDL